MRFQHIRNACPCRLSFFSACLFIAATASWNAPVHADCQPDSATDLNPPSDPDDWLPQPGGTVTCTGGDPDGFARDGLDFPRGMDNLTIIVVAGATVGGNGIRLSNSNGSTITNNGDVTIGMSIYGNQASITNSGSTGGALVSGANASFVNSGTIMDAIAAGAGATATNYGTVNGALQVIGQGGALNNTQGAHADTVSANGDGVSVTNDGQITRGILVGGSNVTVTNNQDVIATTGFLPTAISIDGSGAVQNNGNVSAFAPLTSGQNQNGIIGFADDSMTIINAGSVDSTGVGIGIEFNAAPVGALGTITNSGSVITSGDYAAGLGLIGSGTLTNTATGTILTQGAESEGIGAEGDGVDILNANSIHTMGDYSAGIDKTGDFGTVTNDVDGTIQTDLGGSPGILVVGDNFFANPTIINNGTIMTDGYFSPGIAVNGLGNFVQNVDGSSITTTGDDADGILTNNVRVIENGGTITTQGLLSDGIEAAGQQVVIDTATSTSAATVAPA